jgi:hypothetical protein
MKSALEMHIDRALEALGGQPDDKEIISRYYLLAEMNWRTFGCYREDGSEMSDEEYMKSWEEGFGSLEDFIAKERAKKLDPFGGKLAAHDSPISEIPSKKKAKGHVDFSDRM